MYIYNYIEFFFSNYVHPKYEKQTKTQREREKVSIFEVLTYLLLTTGNKNYILVLFYTKIKKYGN
jgi:hypothetical protein